MRLTRLFLKLAVRIVAMSAFLSENITFKETHMNFHLGKIIQIISLLH